MFSGRLRSLLLRAAVIAAATPAAAAPALAESMLRVAMPGTAGGLLTRVCRPDVPGPAPLAILNHGSPADPAERPGMQPLGCDIPAARYFLARGYVVALPLRRGYGATGGAWAEAYGKCERADYASAGLASADDIAATLARMHREPYVAKDRTIVVGQSAGGWATLAYASRNPPEVAAFINFAGGRGGGQASGNCSPQALVAAAASFGRTARGPTLWIYTENDRFFARTLSRRMADAFMGAGGSARFVMLAPFGDDGHRLFFATGGARIWGSVVGSWLTEQPVQQSQAVRRRSP